MTINHSLGHQILKDTDPLHCHVHIFSLKQYIFPNNCLREINSFLLIGNKLTLNYMDYITIVYGMQAMKKGVEFLLDVVKNQEMLSRSIASFSS